jgi:uncharacterized protein (TIGR02646 family)
MIRLHKLGEPAILVANGIAWTKTLVDKVAAGEKPSDAEKSRYRHPAIKEVLVQETHGKCAYCESKLQHIHHGDVEHIYPKSLNPTKSFEWTNLTLACEVCNQNKSNKDPLMSHIIDPYVVDPEDHLMFLGGLIFTKGTQEGTSTRILLELHRAELVEMRNRHVDNIMRIYAQIQDVSLPMITRKALYEDLIKNETGPDAQYSAMVKCIVHEMEHLLEDALRSTA